ncbi:CLUMA_CG005235, isoform A [Clunio marinus]|uniref:CLUMA_CG005235, isoform A n=1 Tax=Clunio marinus TaxID=568069 RepID=A0A1J1HUA2_9DIPT|nr:CLUMA_CG005235, isoform A [Clunio marinus]
MAYLWVSVQEQIKTLEKQYALSGCKARRSIDYFANRIRHIHSHEAIWGHCPVITSLHIVT